MIYPSIAAHPLLSNQAKALDPAVLNAQQDVAETLLGLFPPAVTVALTLSRVTTAIVLQMNFQIAQGLDPLYTEFTQSAHSRQMVSYRDRYLDPRAVAIVTEALLEEEGDGYKLMTSYRTQG